MKIRNFVIQERCPKLIRIAYWRTFNLWRRFREWFARSCPVKIRRKFPIAPLCDACGKPMRIIAVDTGDGILFEWDCDEHPGESEKPIENWWIYWFGVWVNDEELERIGIEVV